VWERLQSPVIQKKKKIRTVGIHTVWFYLSKAGEHVKLLSGARSRGGVGKGTGSFLGWTKCPASKSGYRSQGAPAKPVKMATLHYGGFWFLAVLVFDLRVSGTC
jgi:hypothetical protein